MKEQGSGNLDEVLGDSATTALTKFDKALIDQKSQAGGMATYGARSPFYSIWLYSVAWTFNLWGILVTQAAVIAWIIWRAVTHAARAHRFEAGVAIVALGTFGASAWFVVGFVMPDIYAAIVVICVALLFAYADRMPYFERVGLAAILAASAAFHLTHLAVAAALTLAGIGATQFLRFEKRALRSRALLATGSALGVAVALQFAFDTAARAVLGTSPKLPPLLTARVLADGPGRLYLDSVCPETPTFFVCAYRNWNFKSADEFLWSSAGVFQTMSVEQRLRLIEEEPRFVTAVAMHYPLSVLKATVANAVEQFVLVWPAEAWIDPGATFNDPALSGADLFQVAPFLSLCVANLGRCAPTLPEKLVASSVAITVLLSIVVIAAHFVARWRRTTGTQLGNSAYTRAVVFASLILVGLVVNAGICGAISGPHTRYQTRVVWLAVLAAGVLEVAHPIILPWFQRLFAAAMPNLIRRLFGCCRNPTAPTHFDTECACGHLSPGFALLSNSRVVTFFNLPLAVVTGWLLWRSLDWPLVGDATIFHFIAGQMKMGAVPYRDIVDMNMPLTYDIHAAVVAIGGMSDLAWRVFDLTAAAVMSAFILMLVGPAGRAVAILAVLAVLVTHLSHSAYAAGQRDFLLSIPAVAVALVSARAAEDHKHRRLYLLLAGALAMTAASIKPSGILLLFLPALATKLRGREMILILLGAAGVGVLVFGTLAVQGGLGAFITMLSELLPLYTSIAGDARSVPAILKAVAWMAPIGGLAVAAALSIAAPKPPRVRVMIGLTAFGLIHLLAQRKGWSYHFYPLGVGLACWGAWSLAALPTWSVLGCLILIASALGWHRPHLMYHVRNDAAPRASLAMQSALQSHLARGARVQMLDSDSGAFLAMARAGMRQATPHIQWFSLLFAKESGRRKFLAALDADPPDAILLTNDQWPKARGFDAASDWPEFMALLTRGYDLNLAGHEGEILWRLYLRRAAQTGFRDVEPNALTSPVRAVQSF